MKDLSNLRMSAFYYAFVVFIYYGISSGNCQARNVARSGEFGEVNLVELSIKNVVYGRCTFTEPNGEKVELLYEDRDGELSAKASNPTVTDPISKTQVCRELASHPIRSSESKFRTTLSGKTNQETPWDLKNRLDRFQQDLVNNEVYLSYLKPRFIGEMFQHIGITLGGGGNDHFKGIGLHVPKDQNDRPHIAFGGFKPFGGGWRRQ
ncbi:UNVERIFIED_CONTAM: hypothetical protein RMT77_016469 [Armadillidium vulgare]